jgi:hypothetical protein
MKKNLTRRARKEARQRELRKQLQAKSATAFCHCALPAAPPVAHPPEDEEPVTAHVADESEDLDEAVTEDVGMPAEAPAAPSSHVRLVEACEEKEDEDAILEVPAPAKHNHLKRVWKTRAALVHAKKLDEARSLDWRLFHLLRLRYMDADGISSLQMHPTLDGFLQRHLSFWSEEAKDALRVLNGQAMWDNDYRPTEFGEELWRLFRIRVRREGALTNILRKRIRSAAPRAA